MKVIIDRFEGEFAVVEFDKGKFANIPKILLESAREGDVVLIEVDKNRTENRKEKINDLCNELFK